MAKKKVAKSTAKSAADTVDAPPAQKPKEVAEEPNVGISLAVAKPASEGSTAVQLTGSDLDNLDANVLHPDLSKPDPNFRTAFKDMKREDYGPAISEAREEAKVATAAADALEVDYRGRFPQHRELHPAEQNAINLAHGKARRAELRAKRAGDLKKIKAMNFDHKAVAELIGGSRLDRVLRQRGKDPSLRRKPPRLSDRG